MALTPSEILPQIASARKDKYYLDHLRGLFNEVVTGFFGPRQTINWSKEIQLISDFAYFGITTLRDLQTLGEEYTGIIQVNPTMRQMPSVFSRLSMVVARVLVPYLIDKFLAHVENQILKNEKLSKDTNILNAIQRARAIVDVINRLHLSIFYIQGLYSTISNRFSDIKYVKYATQGTNAEPQSKAFKILGVLSLGQCLAALLMNVYSLHKDIKLFQMKKTVVERPDSSSSGEADLPALKCSLCLENRRYTTATPCGHLFCWNCIHSWVQTKAECPICREKLLPRKLVCLMNFP